jgi:hypothetical protein
VIENMSWGSNFQPFQIVYLEHANSRVFAEVVQPIQANQRCWVRPLVLEVNPVTSVEAPEYQVYDLRQGADLIWPVALLNAVLDTDFLPLLAKLHQGKALELTSGSARYWLMDFVKQSWQAHPQLFQTSSEL